jgi:cytochrome c peroxidase
MALADEPAANGSRDNTALLRIEKQSLGLPPVPFPNDNPPTAAKVRLGRKLFFDRRLSHNGTLSCAMCHIPEQGFTGNEIATAVGNEGKTLRRNALTLLNVAFMGPLFHDGRETSLETQVISPLLAPDEMGNPSIGNLLDRIGRMEDYSGLFEAAFDRGASIEAVGQAIATYERTLISANSPFDSWYFGKEKEALTANEREGFRLFAGKANCAKCHRIAGEHALFTDNSFHDTGLGWHKSAGKPSMEQSVQVQLAPGVFTSIDRKTVDSVGLPEKKDLGRYEVTQDPSDLFRFKTPTLRNIALTAPYMHDGSLSTLHEVVAFYNRGGHPHGNLDPLIRPLGLNKEEMDALVAFLNSLTGDNIRELVEDSRSVSSWGKPPSRSPDRAGDDSAFIFPE